MCGEKRSYHFSTANFTALSRNFIDISEKIPASWFFLPFFAASSTLKSHKFRFGNNKISSATEYTVTLLHCWNSIRKAEGGKKCQQLMAIKGVGNFRKLLKKFIISLIYGKLVSYIL